MLNLDPRIGQLMRNGQIVHYAMVNGYGKPPVEGTLEQVEVALGLRKQPTTRTTEVEKLKTWNVKLSFQYPAWDEVDGIDYFGITAKSKSEANAYARRQAENDGHAIGGKGRYWFKATDVEAND